jgi:predicted nucleotidyltransferase
MDQKTIAIMPDIKQYIHFIQTQVEISRVILFGSYATGKATETSDIDLAIISIHFGKAPLIEKMKLYEWRYDANINADIQPVPLGIEDFSDIHNPFIAAIKNSGIDITQNVMGVH